MKPHRLIIKTLCVLFIIGLHTLRAVAQTPDPATPSIAQAVTSKKVELLLKYPPLQNEQDNHLTLYLSDPLSNKPIKQAKIELEINELKNSKIRFLPVSEQPGVYEGTLSFPAIGVYSAEITIKVGKLTDTLILDEISVGSMQEIGHLQEKRTAKRNTVYVGAAVLLSALLSAWLWRRYQRRTLSCILFIALLQTLTSVHAETPDNSQASFHVAKETQFSLKMETLPAELGPFSVTKQAMAEVVAQPQDTASTAATAPETLDRYPHTVYLAVRFFKNEAVFLNKTTRVEIVLADQSKLEGKIIELKKSLPPEEKATLTLIECDNRSKKLELGKWVKVQFTSMQSENMLTLPRSALIVKGGLTLVLVKTEAETFTPRLVKIASLTDTTVYLNNDGIHKGDKVVIQGYETLLPLINLEALSLPHPEKTVK